MNTQTAHNQPRRLAGGTRSQENAESPSGGIIGIVQPDVPWLFPSDKRPGLQIRFKPGFDYDLAPSDPSFPLSFRPYRNRNSNGENGLPVFTDWFATIRAYRFFGNNRLEFTSPETRPKDAGFTDAERADPVAHIRSFCHKNAEYKYLVSKPEKKEEGRGGKYDKAVVGWADSLTLYNVAYVHQDQREPEDAVTFFVYGGHLHLCAQLDAAMTVAMKDSGQFDAKWPEFWLGDQTDPWHGSYANVRKHATGNATASPWCPLWSSQIGTLDKHGIQKAPLSEAQMRKRWDLLSEETIRIESYQRLVEIIVADGAIPREVVARACGGMADIPGTGVPQPTFQTAVTGGMFSQPADDNIPGLPPTAAGPAFQAPAPAQAGVFQAPAPAQAGVFQAPAPAQAGVFQAPATAGSPLAPAALGMQPPGGFLQQMPQQFGAPAAPSQGAPAPFAGAVAPAPFAGAVAPAPLAGAARSLAPQADVPFSVPPPAGAAMPPPAPAMPPPAPVMTPQADPAEAVRVWAMVKGVTTPEMSLKQAAEQGATHVCLVLESAKGWLPLDQVYKPQASQPAMPPAFQQPAATMPTGAGGKLNAQEFATLQQLQERARDHVQAGSMSHDEIKLMGSLQIRMNMHGVE